MNKFNIKNDGDGCWSYLGQMITLGGQNLNLGNGFILL